jgi:Fe-S-cluster containining protein
MKDNTITMPPNLCRRCGECCKHLILEVTGLDLMREPRWLLHAQKYRGIDYRGWQTCPDEYPFLVNTAAGPCPFYDDKQGCTIYPSRPDMCVKFRAGRGKQCAYSPKCVFGYRKVEP